VSYHDDAAYAVALARNAAPSPLPPADPVSRSTFAQHWERAQAIKAERMYRLALIGARERGLWFRHADADPAVIAAWNVCIAWRARADEAESCS
jgi:hypothetical protein